METTRPLRIVFAGTPDFSVPPLKLMIDRGFTPGLVLTQPDRRAGRGLKLQSSPVKQCAEAAGIDVFQPESLKNTEVQAQLAAQNPDLMIVVAYGLLLPKQVLDLPRLGCWNIHASLLPRWRGAAPIQRAIEAGDEHSGVCIMQMDEGLDTGAVLARKSIALAENETGGSLHDRLAELGAQALLECLERLLEGPPPQAVPQAESGISYARKLSKQEAQIDWNEPAGQIERRIRAFNPWPVCWTELQDERTRIWEAQAEARPASARSGEILHASSEGIVIACGAGQLRITRLQRPGGKPQTPQEYLQSRSLSLQSLPSE